MSWNLFFLTIILISTPGFLSAWPDPRIDQTVILGPYQYIDSIQLTQKRLFLDEIFSGFNLSFDYWLNNSTEQVSIPKNLNINKTLTFVPKNFILVKQILDPDVSLDVFVILYNDSVTLLKIQADGNESVSQSNFSSLDDVQCNDFVQPDTPILILNCWNSTKNQGTLGYLTLETLKISFIDVQPSVTTDLARTGLRKIPKGPSLVFWRFYQGEEWVIEEWRIDPTTAATALTRSFNYTHLDSSFGISELRELHILDINVTVLANATNALALVNWAPAVPDVLDTFNFDGGANLTGAKLLFTSDMSIYLAKLEQAYLQVFDLSSYQFENLSSLLRPGLAEIVCDYDVINDHALTVQSINVTSGKSYLSIATFFTKTDPDVIYIELPTIPAAGAVKKSSFSTTNTSKFYYFNESFLTTVTYTKPILKINPKTTPRISNVITLQATSSTLDQQISKNFSILVYYYNETFFTVDTSGMISPDQFIYGLYPTAKTITLKDIGVKAPTPVVIYVGQFNYTVLDSETVRYSNIIQTPDGIAARDPLGAYWIFKMDSQTNVYRCQTILSVCEFKGKVHWPLQQKRVEVIMDGYPHVVMSYPSSDRVRISTFSVSRVSENATNTIEEKYFGDFGAHESSNCQSMKVKKIKNSSYLLCLDTDRNSGNTSLTIFYIDDLANVSSGIIANSLRNVSIPLERFPLLDQSGSVGLRMELSDDLMFVIMEANFTLFCYNLSNVNYSSSNVQQIALVEQHQAFNLLKGGLETYLFVNSINKILILACPQLGMFEEWLIVSNSSSGSVLQYYGQTLTYGETFDSDSVPDSEVASPVSYSISTNTLYMMTSSTTRIKLYVYQINPRCQNYQLIPRLARGIMFSNGAYDTFNGVSAVANDLDSDYVILWGTKTTLHKYYSELKIVLDTSSSDLNYTLEIYELQLTFVLTSEITLQFPTILNVNFSLYYLEDPITPVNLTGQYANKIMLGETPIIWAFRPEDYFSGGIIDLEMTTGDPSDATNHHVRLFKRIEDDYSCKISNAPPDTRLLAAYIGADGYAYLLTSRAFLKLNTTTIYVSRGAPAYITNLPSPIPENVTNFLVGPEGQWMQVYLPQNKTIQAYNLSTTPPRDQLTQGISTGYNFSKNYQVAFLNRSFLSLTLECSSGTEAACSNQTFISLWNLTGNAMSIFLQFSDFSNAIGINITNKTQIVTKLQSPKAQNQTERILLLAAVTDNERNLYLLTACLIQISNKSVSCYLSDLKALISDYNISRYGVDWNLIDIMSSNYNQGAFTGEVLLGNKIYNSYVINIALFQSNNTCVFNVSYGLDNYLPNTCNTKIAWSESFIAVERGANQIDNNLTNSDPHVLYYDRISGDTFNIGQDYDLLRTFGVSKLKQHQEIAALDPSQDRVLKLPLRISNNYEVFIRDFSPSVQIEFKKPDQIKSTELTISAQNYGSFSSVKIQLEKTSKPPANTYVVMIIAFGLLLISAIVGGLYYVYQKRAKAKRMQRQLLLEAEEEDGRPAEGVNPSDLNETSMTETVTFQDRQQP